MIIWKTLSERSLFGFMAYADVSPQFFYTDAFLEKIISQEDKELKKFQKVLTSFFILNAIALLYVNGIQMDFVIWGNKIPQIPASGQILCFFLGANLFALSISMMNVLTLSRMVDIIARKARITDLPNMAVCDLKGGNVWADFLVPKVLGFKSNVAHFITSLLVLVILVCLCLAIIVAGLAGLITTFKFGIDSGYSILDWSFIVSVCGLVFGVLGIFIFIFCMFVPYKFTFDEEELKSLNSNQP